MIRTKNNWLIALGTLLLVCLMSLSSTSANGRLYVHLEAKPSKDCFPASALQLPELEEDFSKSCTECILTEEESEKAQFSIVVEDPGCKWLISLYDSEGRLIKEYKWSGSLKRGLDQAVSMMRQKTK